MARCSKPWAATLNVKQAVDEHRAVVDAIAAHDPEMARAAMSGHLDRSHGRFSASLTTPHDA